MLSKDPRRLKDAKYLISNIGTNLSSLTEALRSRAPEFFDDAAQRAHKIHESIEHYGGVADEEYRELESINQSVRRWIHGRDA